MPAITVARTAPPAYTNTLTPKSAYPTPYGILSVAQTPTPTDSRWVNGITWEHPSCAPVTGIFGACADDIDFLVGEMNKTTAVAVGLNLQGSHTCMNPNEGDDYARANLERHRQEGIEYAISAVDRGAEPNFAGAADLGTAASVREGLGILSQHAGEIFGTTEAVIHAPRFTSGFMAEMVERVGGHLETLTGEFVSLGAGYSNLSPTGTVAAAGTAWMYVTPPVMILLGQVETYSDSNGSSSTFDFNFNLMRAIATQPVLFATDDCPYGAVLVTLA